ncbi:MAG: hypothetical protein ACLTK1_05725 [Veillonella parvula]
MKKRELLFCLSLVCMVPIHILGAKPIDTQEQLDRAREQQLAREAAAWRGTNYSTNRWNRFFIWFFNITRWLYSTGTTASTCRAIFLVSHIRVVEEPISQSAELTYSNMINTTMDQTTFVDNSSAASVRLIKGPLYYEAQKRRYN